MNKLTQLPAEKKNNFRIIWVVLGWLFGSSFILTGVVMVWEIPSMGMAYFIGGLLLLPPLRAFVSKKFKILALIVLYVIMSAFIIWSLVDLMIPKFPH
jgi:hypothetical protein